MKRLVTSDWQLADNARDSYRLAFVCNTLPDLIEKYKPDQLLVLGDLTEAKDNHPASLVNAVAERFAYFSKVCEVIILQGNHDYLHINHPFFQFLDQLPRVSWINRPTVRDNCLYLPHTRNHKKDWQGLDFKGHDFIFAHNIFAGVSANGRQLSGIPTDVFPDDSCVIAGDVHEPQSFDVVTYVGAPFLCDFGDSYRPRVIVLDGHSTLSVKVKGPQKRLVELIWPEEKSSFNKASDHVCGGDIVKIKVHLQMQHVAEWDKIRDYLWQWGNDRRKWNVHTIQPIVEYQQGKLGAVKSDKKSDDEYFAAYAKRTGIDAATAEVGKDLMGD